MTGSDDLVERLESSDGFRVKTMSGGERAIVADVELLREAAARIKSLEGWKAEALLVLGEWDDVFIALDEPGELGDSKAAGALEAVRELMSENEEMRMDAAMREDS